jgi:hypothetical protein
LRAFKWPMSANSAAPSDAVDEDALRQRYPSSGESDGEPAPKKRGFQSKVTKALKRTDTAAKMKFEVEEADGLNGRKPRELDATQDRTVIVGDTFASRYISFAFIVHSFSRPSSPPSYHYCTSHSLRCLFRWDAELSAAEAAASRGCVLLKNGSVSDCKPEVSKVKGEPRAHFDAIKADLRCAGCADFFLGTKRTGPISWICVRADGHSADCKGGNHLASVARVEHAAALRTGTNDPIKANIRGKNPHHRTFSFEAKFFVRVVAALLEGDVSVNRRGAAAASVQSLRGLLQAYMLQPVSHAYAKRCRTLTLNAMFGNAQTDVTLVLGVQVALKRCGFGVDLVIVSKKEMEKRTLASQKVF